MISQFYESFNARNYTPREVAETFIPSQDYWDLWHNEHTIVLGPRGSGKTTLFKMLTVQALYAWSNPTAEELRGQRPFTAIYVPTDMHWHHQLKHAEEHLTDAPRFSASASRTAVTTSVLIAVARAFIDRLEHEGPGSEHQHAELCSQLIREWRLPSTLPRLELVVLGLKSRIAELRRLVNQAVFRNSKDSALTDVPDYFHLDYFASMDVACGIFDAVFSLPQSKKWALCLDELEIAPAWVQSLAFSQQRSTEERFLIKLSTSPLPSIVGTTEARPKQDVRLIAIWNYPGRGADDFADRLASSVLKRKLGDEVSPVAFFGASDPVAGAESDVEKYEPGSAEWHLFRDLASWDESFRMLLVNAGIDPENPATSNIAVRDSVLRKAKPIAVLRQAFLKRSESGRLLLRSRKLATIYCGREAIYRASDGNPRRLIGILGDLVARARGIDGTVRIPMPANEQADVLERTSRHFFGYVHALPGGDASLGPHHFDLATLLRAIATFFRQRLLGPDFLLDPVGSFRVDSNINEKVVELLRLGVYHGAVVHVDPVPDTIETSLRGKRFRLSYMLGPLNRLPLHLYDPISLSTILRASSRLRVKRALPAIMGQRELGLDP